MTDVADYLQRIAAEHSDKPDYLQSVTVSLQPGVDGQNLLAGMTALFDLDRAVGQQLDYVGQWIGPTRYLSEGLDVYFGWSETVAPPAFAWGDAAAGWDQGGWYGYPPFVPPPPNPDNQFPGWGVGVWREANSPSSAIVALDDPHYRILLKATVVANYWDGTIPGAYKAWNTLFAPEGYQIIIQDGAANVVTFFGWGSAGPFYWGIDGQGWGEAKWWPVTGGLPPTEFPYAGWGLANWYDQELSSLRVNGDMTVILGLIAPASATAIDPVTEALFTGGFLGLESAGVAVRYYATQSVIGLPMFGWGAGPLPSTIPYMSWGVPDLGWGLGDWLGTPVPPPSSNPIAPPINMAGWGQAAWPLLTPGS